MVERKFWYVVNHSPPMRDRYNNNVTLHFKLEKLSMTGLARGSEDAVGMSTVYNDFEAYQTFIYKFKFRKKANRGSC